MKKQAIIAAAALAVGFAAQVNAQPAPVYITGSTAFRSQAISAIELLFDGGAPTNIVTRGNTDEHKAAYSILSGNVSGSAYDVFILWSGSEAGLAALSGTTVADVDFNGNPDTLANDVTYFLNKTATGKSNSNPNSTETNNFSTPPDMSFADTSKAVSFSKSATFHVFGASSVVGIVPFTYVKCTNSNTGFTAWNHLTNITHDQCKVEFGAPQVASFFTGVAGDTNNVFLVGRNKGSGTRANVLADNGFGINNPVDQWVVDPASADGHAGDYTPGNFVPLGAVDPAIIGYQVAEIGNAGFESGGNVSADLSIDGCSAATDPTGNGNTGVILIGYLGIPDATANSMGPANTWLTLNGVFESDDAIAQGQYSYWGYEHLYGKNGLSGSQLTYGNSLFAEVNTFLGTLGNGAGKHSVGIQNSYMQCTKGSDTAFPTHN